MALYLTRIAIGLLFRLDDHPDDRKAFLNDMFRAHFNDWTKDLSQKLARLLNKAKTNRLAPKLCAEIINEAANCPDSDRPRGFAIEDFTVGEYSLIDNDKARQRALDGSVILYVDRWGLSLLTFDVDGVEAEASFNMRRITGWQRSGTQTLKARLEPRIAGQPSQILSVTIPHIDDVEVLEVLQARCQGRVPTCKAVEPDSQALTNSRDPTAVGSCPARTDTAFRTAPMATSTLAQDVQKGLLRSPSKAEGGVDMHEDLTIGSIPTCPRNKKRHALANSTTVVTEGSCVKPSERIGALPENASAPTAATKGGGSEVKSTTRETRATQTVAMASSVASSCDSETAPSQAPTALDSSSAARVRDVQPDSSETDHRLPGTKVSAEIPQPGSRSSSTGSGSPAATRSPNVPASMLNERPERIRIIEPPKPPHFTCVVAVNEAEQPQDLDLPSSLEFQPRNPAKESSTQHMRELSVLPCADADHPRGQEFEMTKSRTSLKRHSTPRQHENLAECPERLRKRVRLSDAAGELVGRPGVSDPRAQITQVTTRILDLVLDSLSLHTTEDITDHSEAVGMQVKAIALDFALQRHSYLHEHNKLLWSEASTCGKVQEKLQRDGQRLAAFDEGSRAFRRHVDTFVNSVKARPALPAISS